MPLTAGYWIYAVLLAAVAVCWSYVLVQPGMLLCGVQSGVRAMHKGFTVRRWMRIYFSQGPPPTDEEKEAVRISLEGQYHTSACLLDDRWWWKPLWGCPPCCAGQAGLWGYLLLFPLSSYSLLAHLGFAAITILFAAAWRAIYAWSQSVQ